MPHEYTDNEDREPPYNSALATEQGISGGGGYSVPGVSGVTLRGYKSTAVMLDGHGSAVTVEVGWTHSDDAAGIVMLETKVQTSADPSTLFFVNMGDTLDHVTLTGGGNIDYSVVESNQLPLPVSTAATSEVEYPSLYDVPIFDWAVGEDQTHWQTVTLDAAYPRNAIRVVNPNNVVDAFFTTHVLLGPRYSLWQIIMRTELGPTLGKLSWELGTPTEAAPGSGLTNDAALLQGSSFDGLTYVTHPDSPYDMYAAVTQKNVITPTHPEFRIMGAPGTPLTAFAATGAPDNAYYAYQADGGPGVYNLRLAIRSKNAAASAYGARVNSLVLRRVDYLGF